FLAVALLPVALWLIPAFSKVLARGAFEAHRKLFGKGGVYVRLPGSEPIRLRDTLLMSIGPFAIDVLVMAEILFLQGTADLRQLRVFVRIGALPPGPLGGAPLSRRVRCGVRLPTRDRTASPSGPGRVVRESRDRDTEGVALRPH